MASRQAQNIDVKKPVEHLNLPEECYMIRQQFRMAIIGPSRYSWFLKLVGYIQILEYTFFSSGKSRFILKCLQNGSTVIEDWDSISRIIYCAPVGSHAANAHYIRQLQDAAQNKMFELVEGSPDIHSLNLLDFPDRPTLLICDDLMQSILSSIDFLDIMTIHSHHCKINVMFSIHSYFHQAPLSKSILRQVTDHVLLFNRGESLSYRTLSGQLFPHKTTFLLDCLNYLHARSTGPYPLIYLHIDNNPQNNHLPPLMQTRSHIFPLEDGKAPTPMYFFPN